MIFSSVYSLDSSGEQSLPIGVLTSKIHTLPLIK